MLRQRTEARLKSDQDFRRRPVAAERLGDRIRVLHDLADVRRRRVALGNRLVIVREPGLFQFPDLKPQHVQFVLASGGHETQDLRLEIRQFRKSRLITFDNLKPRT